MFACLQHGHARVASADRAGASGEGCGFEGHCVTWLQSAACTPPCKTRHRTRASRQPMKSVPAGQEAGSRAVDSLGVHVLHVCAPATRCIARTRVNSRWSWRQRGRAQVRAVDSLSVHVLHARQPATRSIARTQGFSRWNRRQRGGRGFEGRRLTRRSCAASSHPCNTRHRTQARCQSMEPAPARKGAGSRPINSPSVHVLHVRLTATRGIARTRGVSQWSQRQRGKRGLEGYRLTGRSCAAC